MAAFSRSARHRRRRLEMSSAADVSLLSTQDTFVGSVARATIVFHLLFRDFGRTS
jgi:hypothetical protein